MTTQHTPEPWHVGRKLAIGVYGPDDDSVIAMCDSMGEAASDKANARRIVACVNACAGIDTAQLETEAGKLFPQPRLLTAQRDELADALRNLTEAASLIVERWSSGDLAEAVRSLNVELASTRGTLDKFTKLK